MVVVVGAVLSFGVGVGVIVGTQTDDAHDQETAPIDDSLYNKEGEFEVLVRVNGTDESITTESENSVSVLQSHAEQTQRSVLEYASSTSGVEVRDKFWIMNAVLVEIDTEQVSLNRLASIENVERIQANGNVSVTSTASTWVGGAHTLTDSTGGYTTEYTYGLEQIAVPEAQTRFRTKGENATIAVLDTGVDARNHTELEPVEGGWKDFISNRDEPYDDNGHGTHVSGIAVGNQTAGGVQYGVAPNARLIHGKVTTKQGTGRLSVLLAGLEWVVTHDTEIDVLSLSIGTSGYIGDLVEPVSNVEKTGIVVVASVGNEGVNTSISPGNVYDSVAIGASAKDRSIASFSGGETINTTESWGETAPDDWPGEYVVPDVSAPGNNIKSAVRGGGYRKSSGTSMAAPHVAGTVALTQSATADRLPPRKIKQALNTGAWKPTGVTTEPDTRYGYGIVDAYITIDEVASVRCGTIVTAGLVKLDANITGDGACFTVQSDDVVIDANGYTIGGQEGGSAVRLEGTNGSLSNVTIRNGTLDGWTQPINTTHGTTVERITITNLTITDASGPSTISDGNDIVVQNVSIDHQGGDVGLSIEGVTNLKLADLSVDGNHSDGIVLQNVSSVALSETVVHAGTEGTGLVHRGQNTTINDSVFSGNGKPGIQLDASTAVTLNQVAVAGETAFRATNGSTDITGSAIRVEDITDIKFDATDVTLDKPETTPEPPSDKTAVTAHIEVRDASTVPTMTIPYALSDDQRAENIRAAVNNETRWENINTNINIGEETVTATVFTTGVLAGFVPVDESDHVSGVSQSVFDAVDENNNGSLSLRELRNAVADWSRDRRVADVTVTLSDLRKLVAWWR